MSQLEDEPWDWSQITHADAVARLFPEVADRAIVVDDFMPGRSWNAGEKPHKSTPLDDAVAKLLARSRRPRVLPRERLAADGIRCPFYAVRYHTAVAIRHACHTHLAFSPARKEKLINERERWRRRAAEARVLFREHDVLDAVPIGSIHLRSGDVDPLAKQEILAARELRYQELKDEADRDDQMVAMIGAELQRLDYLKGRGNPDTGSTAFFVYMANLWTVLTAEPVPAAGEYFTDLLLAATTVASGGKRGIREWGQAKTLRPLFKNASPGEGFRIGEEGWFCGENELAVMERGCAIRELSEIMQAPEKYGHLKSALASGAFLLRDHEHAPLALIMREEVLRPILTEVGLLPAYLEAQLGWLNVPKPREMRAALQVAFSAARAGDLRAAAVVQCAYACKESARRTLTELGWSEPYAGFTRLELNELAQSNYSDDIDGPLRDGNDKAFDAAMALINIIPPQNSQTELQNFPGETSFGLPLTEWVYHSGI